MRFLALSFVGYACAWWGMTMLVGGPNNTGSWPLMYALFKLGTPPPTPPTKGGSNEASPTSPSAPFQASPTTTPSPGGHFMAGPI